MDDDEEEEVEEDEQRCEKEVEESGTENTARPERGRERQGQRERRIRC